MDMLNVVRNILAAVMAIFVACNANAYTWTKITTIAINVTAGAACSGQDIGEDASKNLYTCKGGVWTAVSGGAIAAGSGLRSVWLGLAGKSIYCSSSPNVQTWAYVDANGVPYVRVQAGSGNTYSSCDSGYVQGTWASCSAAFESGSATLTFNNLVASERNGGTCTTVWPW